MQTTKFLPIFCVADTGLPDCAEGACAGASDFYEPKVARILVALGVRDMVGEFLDRG